VHFLYSWLGSRLPAGSGSTSKNIMRDWQQIAVESHYLTAVGVKEALEAGDIHEALRGIDELIDAMRRSEQRAVRSQFVRLMTHTSSGTHNRRTARQAGLPPLTMPGRRFGIRV